MIYKENDRLIMVLSSKQISMAIFEQHIRRVKCRSSCHSLELFYFLFYLSSLQIPDDKIKRLSRSTDETSSSRRSRPHGPADYTASVLLRKPILVHGIIICPFISFFFPLHSARVANQESRHRFRYRFTTYDPISCRHSSFEESKH